MNPITLPTIDPATASLTDIQRAYEYARRAVRLAHGDAECQLATHVRSELAAYRRARMVTIARRMTGDQTIGLGLLSRFELEQVAKEGGTRAVRDAAHQALDNLDEEAHLKTILGRPGVIPIPV